VVVELGAQSGLIVPLIAVHLFVFYFGLMADVTPPVGLASFAAAAIARCDPIKAGVTAFFYSMRTAILPFLFIFNTQLLMIGLDGPLHLVLTVVSATVAMLVFAAATQGYFLVKSRWYETIALLLITFTLFRPGYWWDMVYPPFVEVPAAQINPLIEEMPANAGKRLWIEGTNMDGKDIRKGVLLPLGPKGTARERLASAGVNVMAQGFKIVSAEIPADRPAKEWMFVPASVLLLLVMALQRVRAGRLSVAAGAPRSRVNS